MGCPRGGGWEKGWILQLGWGSGDGAHPVSVWVALVGCSSSPHPKSGPAPSFLAQGLIYFVYITWEKTPVQGGGGGLAGDPWGHKGFFGRDLQGTLGAFPSDKTRGVPGAGDPRGSTMSGDAGNASHVLSTWGGVTSAGDPQRGPTLEGVGGVSRAGESICLVQPDVGPRGLRGTGDVPL